MLALRILEQLRSGLNVSDAAQMLNTVLAILHLCALAELHDRGLIMQTRATSGEFAEEAAALVDNTSTYMA